MRTRVSTSLGAAALSALLLTFPGPAARAATLEVEAVAVAGDAAPAELGGTFAEIVSASIMDAGDVLFSAKLDGGSTPEAVILRTASGTTVVARAGDDAPGGGRFAGFGEVDVSREGVLLFQARLEEGEGLFLLAGDGLTRIAASGERSPRGSTYASFESPTVISFVNDDGVQFKLAFLARMADGVKSIVIHASYSDPAASENLATGDVLRPANHPERGEEVLDIQMSRLGISLTPILEVRRVDTGKQYKTVVVHDGFTAWSSKLLREGLKVRRIGKVTRLVGPPATHIQTAFLVVETNRGRDALVARALNRLFLLARVGDPAPGDEGATIASIGLPVANELSSPEEGWPLGVVSPVTLDDGRAALWNAVYPDGTFDAGTHELLLVDGASPSGNGPRLSAMTPVKLTNTGRLLLRGVTGESAREGIFVLRGVFDR